MHRVHKFSKGYVMHTHTHTQTHTHTHAHTHTHVGDASDPQVFKGDHHGLGRDRHGQLHPRRHYAANEGTVVVVY